MTVVDSSALIAIFENEADAERYKEAINSAGRRLISAVNVLETWFVMRGRHGMGAVAEMWRFLEDNDFAIIPFSTALAVDAIAAYDKFCKGTGSPAKLNLSDCAAYALAKSMGMPLPCKHGNRI